MAWPLLRVAAKAEARRLRPKTPQEGFMSNRSFVLSVQEPSVVELTAQERLRLGRLDTSEAQGAIAADDGRILEAGTSTLHLETGFYGFRSLSDIELQVVSGGVDVKVASTDKDG